MMGFWLLFVAAAAVIGLAGPVLSRSASAIADGTRMGQGWIGVILLATVTSLPELATGLSAVAYWYTPNIAVGDALVSCVFNLAILMVLDSMLRGNGGVVEKAEAAGHVSEGVMAGRAA